MLEIDPATLTPEIAELLMARGSTAPPLQWFGHPNRIAKANLERLDNAKLFRREQLCDAAMAAAVRALLFLWNGWPTECVEAAATAPSEERAYLEGLCARLNGRPVEAKNFFGQHEGHWIHEKLAAKAIEIIGESPDPLLARFHQMLEMTNTWEPHLFVDLFEQARNGKLKPAAEEAVRQIQCVEFELLLRECYEAATGQTLPAKSARPAKPVDHAENLERMRRLAEKHRPKRSPRDRTGKPDASKAKQKPDSALVDSQPKVTIRVACPKCRSLLVMPESARGAIERCGKCSTAFLVPRENAKPGAPKAAAPSAPPPIMPANTFAIRCPKCATTLSLPEKARGATERCGKCGTAFIVPAKQAATPART